MTHDLPNRWELYERGVDFITSEADVGLTFARIAVSAPYRDRRERNQANARKAYDSARDWRERLPLKEADSHDIEEKLVQLRSILEQLGESF